MALLLADTSIWIDHLRNGDSDLVTALTDSRVLTHPAVIAELALGNLANRQTFLNDLVNLPSATVAMDQEVLALIESTQLYGRGIGYMDVHLLASARLTPGLSLWTRDKRLSVAARDLGVGAGSH
jgi:predicted nucleic acid-binding protein